MSDAAREPSAHLSERTRVVATSSQASCDLEGEAVVLNLATGLYHGLNPVGTRVWSLLREPRTVAAIRDALLEEFDVDAETCLRDLLAVLEEMRTAELIEVCDEGGA